MIINPFVFGGGGGGGGGPGAHRYWRLYITANDGSALFIGVSEVIFRNAGGTDVTTNGGASSGKNGSSFINGSNTTPQAMDGNTTTSGWLSADATPPQWVSADIQTTHGSAQEIKTVNIYGSWNAPDASPSAFEIQWSDDNSAWTTAASFTGQTGWAASELRTFNVF